MGKIGLIADPHVDVYRAHGGAMTAGLNFRAREVLEVLDRALTAAADAGCQDVVVLGDLFNGILPSPQLIRATQDVLWKAAQRVSVHLLKGNHESVSATEGDHALGPLEVDLSGTFVRVYDGPTVVEIGGARVWMVPHAPGKGPKVLDSALAALGAQEASRGLASPPRRLLALHFGIADDETPPYMRDASDSVTVEDLSRVSSEHAISAVFAGNWHRQRSWSVGSLGIVQIGCLCPRGWNDAGLEGYGGLAVYDVAGDSIELVEIPGPRFVSVRSANAQYETIKEAIRVGHHVYVHRYYTEGEDVVTPTEDRVTFVALPDLEEVEAATRSAARAAKSKDTLEEAIAAYVAAMPLPEGVDRSEVLARSRQFLAQRGA